MIVPKHIDYAILRLTSTVRRYALVQPLLLIHAYPLESQIMPGRLRKSSD
jgi:hypothetical protein